MSRWHYGSQSRLERHIAELAFAVVDGGRVILEVRFDDVQAAVKVEITNADTHAGLQHPIFTQGNTPLEPLFPERSVAVVKQKQAGIGIAGYMLCPAIRRHHSPRLRL